MSEALFQTIGEKLVIEDKNVSLGKMMSCPGMLYKGKVFAFFHHDVMVFKLGKEFDPSSQGIKKWSHLQPFKNKAPMMAWFEVPDTKQWEKLARLALEKIK